MSFRLRRMARAVLKSRMKARIFQRRLGVFELFVAAVVAVFLDQAVGTWMQL